MAVDVGDRIGSYQLVSLLGEGGMGRVFAAEHVIIGRKAAIKVLRSAAAADQRLVERLFDEARAAHRVAHPGIVEVFDCGVAPFIGPFLIMELLVGESLAQSLRAQPTPPEPWSATILVQIAGALDATHRAGIVHRDLKPANVFLTVDGRVKLLDFGIAQLHEDALRAEEYREPEAARRSGGVFGTPHFMAPEQTRGEPAAPTMDVYALGVLAFVLFAGRLPFFHADSREVLRLQREAPPPSPRRYRPSLPEALETVLEKALHKDAAARFDSCGALVLALIEALALPQLAQGLPLVALDALASGELTLSAVSAGLAPRLCPRCGDEALCGREFGEVTVDGCTACGGIWFDEGELEHVVAESLGGRESPPFAALAQRRQPGWLRCPICRACLEQRVLAEHGDLVIDHCTSCRGYWLDTDELAELQRRQAADVL